MKRLGMVPLAICRTVYCWIFFVWSLGSVYMVFINIRHLIRTELVDRGDIVTSILCAIYSVVFGIAWWKIVRGKPALKGWAIAANLILILFYFPILFWNWRDVLIDERNRWPQILVGLVGIIIFSIPYHGWKSKSAVSASLSTQQSPDPYSDSYDMTNPQSMNRYVYAMNSSLGHIYPSGRVTGLRMQAKRALRQARLLEKPDRVNHGLVKSGADALCYAPSRRPLSGRRVHRLRRAPDESARLWGPGAWRFPVLL